MFDDEMAALLLVFVQGKTGRKKPYTAEVKTMMVWLAAFLFMFQLGVSESSAQATIPPVAPNSIAEQSGSDLVKPPEQSVNAGAESSPTCAEKAFSSHKLNYFTLSDWPANENAVIKFRERRS